VPGLATGDSGQNTDAKETQPTGQRLAHLLLSWYASCLADIARTWHSSVRFGRPGPGLLRCSFNGTGIIGDPDSWNLLNLPDMQEYASQRGGRIINRAAPQAPIAVPATCPAYHLAQRVKRRFSGTECSNLGVILPLVNKHSLIALGPSAVNWGVCAARCKTVSEGFDCVPAKFTPSPAASPAAAGLTLEGTGTAATLAPGSGFPSASCFSLYAQRQ
jgi:hypothetical protein